MIGITEGYDPAFANDWKEWAQNKPTILITKNFPKISKDFLGTFPSNIIFHVTCTGLSGTVFEPNTPPVDSILDSIKNLNEYQKKHIVLRVDPICPPLFTCNEFNGSEYYENIHKILTFGSINNLRIRVSFLDMYKHIWERLANYPLIKEHLKKYYGDDLHLPLESRKQYLDLIEKIVGRKVEVCGEPGLECFGCISKLDLDTLGIDLQKEVEKGMQRSACACLALKKELIPIKTPCPHNCIYCYWR